MTKIIYLTLMLFIASIINSFGQQSKSLNSSLEGGASDAYVVKNKYYNANLIKQTTLLVVLDKDTTTSLSKLIIKAIKDNWTFSKYSFINESGLSSYEGKEGYCVFNAYNQLETEGLIKSKDKDNPAGYSYMIRSAMNNKANTDFIAEFKLPCFRDKDNKLTLLNYEYLLPVIVRTFQDEQEYYYKTGGKVPKDYKERIHGTFGGHATYYNEGKIKMLKMKIYVCKEGIKCENKTKQNLAKDLKVDESQIIYAGSDELKKIIAAKDDNTALFVSGNVYSLKDIKRIASSQALQEIYVYCSD